MFGEIVNKLTKVNVKDKLESLVLFEEEADHIKL